MGFKRKNKQKAGYIKKKNITQPKPKENQPLKYERLVFSAYQFD